MSLAARDVIRGAMGLADDVAAGRVLPAEIEAHARDAARRVFGRVVGPGDPLWEVQVDVARQVLAAGGVPVGELVEWVAVLRADEPVAPPVSWIEAALAGGAEGAEGEDVGGPDGFTG
jgi:hypothetical protein